MFDKNFVCLEGIVGDDLKKGKSTNGREYITFSLVINSFSKEMADDTERTNSSAYIRIFVYDKRILKHLEDVHFHRGVRATIFGRLTSFRHEIKGNPIISNSVVCRDVIVSKTRKQGQDEIAMEQQKK